MCLPVLEEAHRIADTVAARFSVTRDDLVGPSRTSRASVPRQIAMCLIRRRTVLSLVAIGSIFKRDHTTVIHSVRAAKERMRDNPYLQLQVDDICKELDER